MQLSRSETLFTHIIKLLIIFRQIFQVESLKYQSFRPKVSNNKNKIESTSNNCMPKKFGFSMGKAISKAFNAGNITCISFNPFFFKLGNTFSIF